MSKTPETANDSIAFTLEDLSKLTDHRLGTQIQTILDDETKWEYHNLLEASQEIEELLAKEGLTTADITIKEPSPTNPSKTQKITLEELLQRSQRNVMFMDRFSG